MPSPDLSTINRIAIVGCSGSGKSTLTHEVETITGLPVCHIDQLFWLPNWVERPTKEFHALHDKQIQKKQWIMDGNCTSLATKRFEQADLILFFDYPLRVSFFRIIKRIITTYGKNRQDMADGCHEHINFPFLRYVLNFRKETRPKIVKALTATNKTQACITFKTQSDVDDFLKTLRIAASSR